MNEQAMLKRKIEAYKFASWELHLYLDSHPNCQEAIKRLKETKAKAEALTEEYEKKYGVIFPTSNDTNKFEWINSPWPWELEVETNVDL